MPLMNQGGIELGFRVRIRVSVRLDLGELPGV